MLKIAYIEIDTHAEIAGNFRELMEDSQQISVDYYFSEKILNILELNSCGNIFQVSAKNILEYLKGQNYDLVIIGTVHRYFNIFEKITEEFPTVIIGHNLNFIEASQWELWQNVFKKDQKFRLKLWLKEGLLRKNKVYEKAKGIFVLDENLVAGRYKFLPVFYQKFEGQNFQNERFRLIIVGAVSQKRRNYRDFIHQLKNLETSQKIEIVFLGKAEGEELKWLRDLENQLIENQNIKIVYFKEKLPQNIFEEWMKTADVLYCPVQNETEFFSGKEVYGRTKMSGNIGDAIKYGKTAVFPKNYASEYVFIENEGENFADIFEKKSIKRGNSEKSFGKNKIILDLEKILTNFVENLKQ